MKSTAIKELLIAAYPERAASIKNTRLKPSNQDPDDNVSLIDMIVALWKVDNNAVDDYAEQEEHM